jgi:hypothetical protein
MSPLFRRTKNPFKGKDNPCTHSTIGIIDEETVKCNLCDKLWLSDPEHMSTAEGKSKLMSERKE